MRRDRRPGGFVLISSLALILPFVLVAGTATMLSLSRNDMVQSAIECDRAILAAESGLDEAMYRANIGTLLDAPEFSRTLAPGLVFTVVPTEVFSDGVDLDGDGFADDATVSTLRIESTGVYGNVSKTLVGYIRDEFRPWGVESALEIQNLGGSITLAPGVSISGNDTHLDGTPGDSANDVFGMTIAPPGTVADLSAELDATELTAISGKAPDPSLGVSSRALDVVAVADDLMWNADTVLASNEYQDLAYGDAATSDFRTTVRDGNLTIKGDSHGAGVLVVTGDLLLQGTNVFEGIIIVLGHVEFQENATIIGSLITGPTSEHVQLEGTTDIRYSADAVTPAGQLIMQRSATVKGWQDSSTTFGMVHAGPGY